MSKLLQRPERCVPVRRVYRTLAQCDEILHANARPARCIVARIDLAGANDKAVLPVPHRADARVPATGFGGNWERAGGLPERPVLDDGGAATCC